MTATLELYDGSRTIDLLGGPYHASRQVRFEPPPARAALAGNTLRAVHYSPRTVEVDLNVRATSVSGLRDSLRDLESVCAVAERRMSMAEGGAVKLRCQLGSVDAQDVEYRVLRGEVALPPALMQEPTLSTVFAAPGARLRLLVSAFGRLAAVSNDAVTLHNEQDGANVNHFDLTGIGGTHGAKAQIKIAKPGGPSVWSSSRKMWIAKRSGPRRSDALFFQGESGTGVEGASPLTGSSSQTWTSEAVESSNASGSGNNVARLSWSHYTRLHEVVRSYTKIGYLRITVPGRSVPSGLFRVLARVSVGGNALTAISAPTSRVMGFALGWSYRGRSRTPREGDEARLSSTNQFRTLDLGELALSPVSNPDGYTPPDLHLNIHGIIDQRSGASRGDLNTYRLNWDIDYVLLLPIDEGAAIVDSVGASDRILLDTISDTPGVHLLDSADTVRKFADFAGGPFNIGPDDTRIYVVRDDTGDPSSVQFALSTKHIPLVAGV